MEKIKEGILNKIRMSDCNDEYKSYSMVTGYGNLYDIDTVLYIVDKAIDQVIQSQKEADKKEFREMVEKLPWMLTRDTRIPDGKRRPQQRAVYLEGILEKLK